MALCSMGKRHYIFVLKLPSHRLQILLVFFAPANRDKAVTVYKFVTVLRRNLPFETV